MAYAYKTFILVGIEGYPGDIPMHHALVLRYCFCSFHIQLLCSFMLVCCIKQRPILLGGRAFEGIGVTRANDLFIVVIGFRAVCFFRYKSPNGMASYAGKQMASHGFVSEVRSHSSDWLRPGSEKGSTYLDPVA